MTRPRVHRLQDLEVKGSLNGSGVSRRLMLKTCAALTWGLWCPAVSLGQEKREFRQRLLAYLESLADPGGGYAWRPGGQPHLTPTFGVVGCYQFLEQEPPRKAEVLEFLRVHHPSRLKRLEQEQRRFEVQQMRALKWLGADLTAFRDTVRGWIRPPVYLKQYEQHGYPILANEVSAFLCRAWLGLPMDELAAHYVPYLDSRRRPNGSFNNTPAADGADGHIVNTWWGLEALRTLARQAESREATISWLRACQLPGGGFTWQPKPPFAGNDDVFYAWAAVRSLHLLGAQPADPEGCVRYLLSLLNADGGFGDRPGWLSNPVASYYALDALAALDALQALQSAEPKRPRRKRALPGGLKVFSTQIEAHGQGSPSDAVELARALGIQLWGAKNASANWLATAQTLADRRSVPVLFFCANEEYGTWVNVPGMGTYSHTSDIMAPAGADPGASLAKSGVVTWQEFRAKRWQPLVKANGRLLWQFGENEELVRLFLDDSVERGGYAAISTFHFGNPDFINSEPFLQRYRGHLPFVALQDAHGEEPWWFADMTTGFRTLFLAEIPTWEGWLRALENDWVAAVRHDAVSGHQTWIHAGRDDVLATVKREETNWRWWDHAQRARPLVSLVAVKPGDLLESARPSNGVMLRVRCARENTTQGLPKAPLAELIRLTVDGTEVTPTFVQVPGRMPNVSKDYYYQFHLPEPSPGSHTATAVVRRLDTQALVEQSCIFIT